MQQPLVSVIIPAYNGEKYIAEAIKSVLNQGYDNYELIVIDNNSNDNTKNIIQSYPKIKYVYFEVAGTAQARHKGVSIAQGEYIAFLDQDDVWVEGKLNKQINFLENNPQYSAVIGSQQMYLQEGHQKPHWLKQEFLTKPQPGYLPSALVVRRSAFAKTDNFDWNYFLDQAKQLKLEQFTHTALRYAHEQQFVQLPEEVLNRLNQYQPTREEIRFFKLITEKPKKFTFIFQTFWSYHVRNSDSQNPLILALTLPHFLKKFWQLKHWHQLPIFLLQRMAFHFKKDIVSGNA